MISKDAWRFCNEDISKIENYNNAISDRFITWHCHHRKEILPNGGFISKKELKKKNLYFNRPAEELIFLTPTEHIKIHNIKDSEKQKSLKYLQNINSFSDFLNIKKEIQKKYNTWIIRHPENKNILEREKNKIINSLLNDFEKKEQKKLKNLDKMKEFDLKLNLKKITLNLRKE